MTLRLPLRHVAVAVLAALNLSVSLGASDQPLSRAEATEQFMPPEPPSGYTAKSIAYAHQDMVSAANPLAVQVCVDILG